MRAKITAEEGSFLLLKTIACVFWYAMCGQPQVVAPFGLRLPETRTMKTNKLKFSGLALAALLLLGF